MGKLFDLINKDTKHKNESKRMTVIIRQMVLIFMCVSVFNLILDAFFIKSLHGSILWAVMLVVDGITFYVSYKAPKLILLTIFVFQKALWITAAVVLFGWEGGFQFFLILLVIMYSFGEAGYNRKKVLLDFCLFAMFIVFLIFFKGNPGKISIEHVDKSIQVVNALAFVIMVSIISFSFSKESQHLEDKREDTGQEGGDQQLQHIPEQETEQQEEQRFSSGPSSVPCCGGRMRGSGFPACPP